MPSLNPAEHKTQARPHKGFSPENIEHLIEADILTCSRLLALLQQEQVALKSHKREDLGALVAEKHQHIDALEKSSQQRHQLLQTAGLEVSHKAWAQMLADLDASHPNIHLCTRWSLLSEQFKQCNQQNEINGKMIVRGQQTMSRLLNLLRGQSTAPALYDRGGSTNGNSSSSHTVVKA